MKKSWFSQLAEVLKGKPKEEPLFGGRKLTLAELRKVALDPLHELAQAKGFREIKDDIWLRQRLESIKRS